MRGIHPKSLLPHGQGARRVVRLLWLPKRLMRLMLLPIKQKRETEKQPKLPKIRLVNR